MDGKALRPTLGMRQLDNRLVDIAGEEIADIRNKKEQRKGEQDNTCSHMRTRVGKEMAELLPCGNIIHANSFPGFSALNGEDHVVGGCIVFGFSGHTASKLA